MRKALLVVVGLLLAPPMVAEDMQLHGLVGGVVSLASDAGTGVEPWACISVDAPVADADMAPHLLVSAALSALPGESLSLADPSTFRALEFSVGFAQPISTKVHFDLYGEAGFATRLPGDPSPRDRTARWAAGGIRFRSEKGYLQVGIGADQRLTGAYRPAVTISGAVQLLEGLTKKLDQKAKMMLVGSAILGLDAPTYGGQPARDVVRIGVAIGI